MVRSANNRHDTQSVVRSANNRHDTQFVVRSANPISLNLNYLFITFMKVHSRGADDGNSCLVEGDAVQTDKITTTFKRELLFHQPDR